jgi:soluble lytic murein transglycosylase-like protein
MQLMPNTAQALGVKDCFDPEQNITAGVRYFQRLKRQFNGSIILALAAYNAGPTRVKKCGGIPEFGITRQYIMRVLLFYHIYKTLDR